MLTKIIKKTQMKHQKQKSDKILGSKGIILRNTENVKVRE